MDSAHLSEEEQYYADTVNRANTFWTEPKKS